MKCPNCQTENRDGAIYCRSCAKPLKANRTCSQCGQVNPADSKFCDKCSKNLEFVEDNIHPSVNEAGTQTQNITPNQYPKNATTISDSSIYEKPDTNSTFLYQIFKDDTLSILGEQGDFYHVQRKPGFDLTVVGYVKKAVVFIGSKNASKNHTETSPNQDIESGMHSVGDVDRREWEEAAARFKARAEAEARERLAAPKGRNCEWCHEPIPYEALTCPRCQKWRKDIEENRVKSRWWTLALVVPMLYLIIGARNGWWDEITLSHMGFSFGKFISSVSGLLILAGFILCFTMSHIYRSRVKREIGSEWWF